MQKHNFIVLHFICLSVWHIYGVALLSHQFLLRLHHKIGGVRKSLACCIDDSICPDERYWHLSQFLVPLPTALELGNIRHDRDHELLAAVHGLGLHVAKPHLQVWPEVLARQLKHRDVVAAVKLQ